MGFLYFCKVRFDPVWVIDCVPIGLGGLSVFVGGKDMLEKLELSVYR